MSSSMLSIQKANTAVCTELYVWGSDSHGQLGLGSKQRLAQQKKLKEQFQQQKYHQEDDQQQQQYSIPKACAYRLPIVKVAAGFRHALLITQKGRIYSVGSNAYGALGIDDNNNSQTQLEYENNNKNNADMNTYSSPILIDALKDYVISNAACGEDFSIAITHDGEVLSWGSNEFGETGIITTTNKISQEKKYYCTPQKLNHLQSNQIVSVSCGRKHSLLLSSSGKVFASGDNRHGQIGIVSNHQDCQNVSEDNQIHYYQRGHVELGYAKDIVEVVCGHYHSLLLSVDGQILSAGLNSHGQLGNGNKLSQKIFKKVKCNVILSKLAGGMYSSGGLSQMGEMYIWGSGVFGEYLIPTQFSKINSPVMQISLGTAAGNCVDGNGVVWSWGDNAYGELGVGDCGVRNKLFPVAALKEKKVVGISCGNGYAIAWGEVFMKKISKEKKKEKEENIKRNEIIIKDDQENSCQWIQTEQNDGDREGRKIIGRKRVVSQYDIDNHEDDYDDLRVSYGKRTNTHGYSDLTTDFSDKKKIEQKLRQHSASFQVDKQNRRVATFNYGDQDYQDIRSSIPRVNSEVGQRRTEPTLSYSSLFQKDKNNSISSIQPGGILEEYLQYGQDKNRRIATSPCRRIFDSREQDQSLLRGKRIETEMMMIKDQRNNDDNYDKIKDRRQIDYQNGSTKNINALWKRMEQDDDSGDSIGTDSIEQQLEYQQQYQKSNDLLMLLQKQQMKNHKKLSSYHHYNHRASQSKVINRDELNQNEILIKKEKHSSDNMNSISLQNKENVNVNQNRLEGLFSKENILKETKKIYENNNQNDNYNTCTLSNSTIRNSKKKNSNVDHSLDPNDSSQRSEQINKNDNNELLMMQLKINELQSQVDTLTAERDQAVLAKDQAILERDTANDERDKANEKSLCSLNELNALKCQIIVEKSTSSGQLNSNSKFTSSTQTPSCNRQKNSQIGKVSSHNQSQSQQGDIDQGQEKQQQCQGNDYQQDQQGECDKGQLSRQQIESQGEGCSSNSSKLLDQQKDNRLMEQKSQILQNTGQDNYQYKQQQFDQHCCSCSCSQKNQERVKNQGLKYQREVIENQIFDENIGKEMEYQKLLVQQQQEEEEEQQQQIQSNSDHSRQYSYLNDHHQIQEDQNSYHSGRSQFEQLQQQHQKEYHTSSQSQQFQYPQEQQTPSIFMNSRQLHKRHHLQLLADINMDNQDSIQDQVQSQQQANNYHYEHAMIPNDTQITNQISYTSGRQDNNSNIPDNIDEEYQSTSDQRHNLLLTEQQQEEFLNAYEQVLMQLEQKDDALKQSLQSQSQLQSQITCLQAAIDGLTIRNQSHQQIQRDLRDKDKLIDELERRCASLKQSERELETRYQNQLEAKRLTLRSSIQHNSPYAQQQQLLLLSANSLQSEQQQSQQQPQQQLQQQYITLSELDSFSAASVSPNQSSCMTTTGISYRPCRFQAKPPRILNNQALDTLLHTSNREKKHILQLNEFELFEIANGEDNGLRGESLTSGEFAMETDGTNTTSCQRKIQFSNENKVLNVQNLTEDEGNGNSDTQSISQQQQQFTLGKPQKLSQSGFPLKLKQLSLQYSDNEEDSDFQQNHILKQQMIGEAQPPATALHVISFSQNLNEDMLNTVDDDTSSLNNTEKEF